MTADYQPTTRELYDLILSLNDVTELGFARIDKCFDSINGRLDRIDARLDSIEAARSDR
jgi:hypothetical protein